MRSTILLVAADPAFRSRVTSFLETRGFDVAALPSGATAFDVLFDHPHGFEAVLLDGQLPLMAGFELVHVLKANGVTRDLPVICLAREAPIPRAEQAFASGCDRYVVAGEDLGDVFRTIRELMLRRAA